MFRKKHTQFSVDLFHLLVFPHFVIDKTLPNLSWFLRQLTSACGTEMCPLLTVSKTLDSPGGMQCTAQVHKEVYRLFPFTYKGMSCVS